MSKTKKILGIIAVIPLLCLALTGCVSEALRIDISSPEDGAELTESPVTVTGIVSGYPRGEAAIGEQTARLVPEVTVNGIKAEVAADGSFSAQVELTEGENAIEAVALLGNQQAKDTITVTYAPSVPVLSVEITLPEDGAELTESPVTVSGTVSDAEATVTVNGIEAEVAEDGSFSAQVGLTEGENTITAVAVVGELEAEASVTVTYTPAPALSLAITSPEDGAELTESPVTVSGTVSDAEATVTVNGVVMAGVVEDGSFSAQVGLTEGENTINAAATLGELQAQDSITVTYSPTPAPVPSVEITSPADGAELTESLVTITGTVSPPRATVTVNGVVVADNGTFSAQVVLTEGQNTITAAATLGQLRAEDSITVTYTPAPALSLAITSPEDGAELTESPVTVSGTVSDAEATVTVNGIEAEVAEDSSFSAQVGLTEGENTITAVAVVGELEAEASVTVTYTPGG